MASRYREGFSRSHFSKPRDHIQNSTRPTPKPFVTVLSIMKKYLGMAFFLLFVSVLVSIKHQQYADNSATNGGNQSIPVSSENAPATKDESQKSKESLHPWWAQAYVLIGWPNGITVWALLLTMAVIAVQTMETRKATESAGKQLAFQQEVLRPRLKITNFTRNTFNEAMAGEWVFVNMEISDSGGFPAYGVIADTWIEFVYGVPPYRFSPMAKYNRADFPLNVHAGTPSGFFIPLHRKLTEEERRNMAGAMGAICFRVRLTYRAFGDEVHRRGLHGPS